MAGDPLVEVGFSSRILHRPLHGALVEVMTALGPPGSFQRELAGKIHCHPHAFGAERRSIN